MRPEEEEKEESYLNNVTFVRWRNRLEWERKQRTSDMCDKYHRVSSLCVLALQPVELLIRLQISRCRQTDPIAYMDFLVHLLQTVLQVWTLLRPYNRPIHRIHCECRPFSVVFFACYLHKIKWQT